MTTSLLLTCKPAGTVDAVCTQQILPLILIIFLWLIYMLGVGERGEEGAASRKSGSVNESVLWETTGGLGRSWNKHTDISGFASVFENYFLNVGKIQEFYLLLRAIPCCSLLNQIRSRYTRYITLCCFPLTFWLLILAF